MEEKNLGRELKRLAIDWGAIAVGFCRTDGLADSYHPEIREKARHLPTAVSLGIALQPAVFDTLDGRPNLIYKAHYRTANALLDMIAFRLSLVIAARGFQALPIPASILVSWQPLSAHLNHREIAFRAGLGWRGKNNLLIHPEHGGRIRLASILTDADLAADSPRSDECGDCEACAEYCPAGAIGGTPELFDLEKCQAQVIAFSKGNKIGQMICGLCLSRCPHAHGR